MLPKYFPAHSGRACLPTLLIALIIAFPLVGRQSPHEFKLGAKWDFTFHGDPLGFSLAVCPDGTVYAIHDRELEIVSSDGHLTASNPQNGLSIKRSPIACDSQKRLIVADHALSVFELDAEGKATQISSVPLKIPVSRVLAAPDGSIYAITADHPSLVLIQPSGKEVLLKEHKYPYSYTIPLAGSVPASAGCALAWDASRQRLAFMLPGQGEIEFFEEPKSGAGRNANPPSTGPNSYACGLLPLTNLVSLPNGQFARTRTYTSELADAFNKTYVEILDGSLALLGQIPANGFGFLIGSPDDGSLYFVAFRDSRENTLTITKRILAIEFG